MIGTAWLKDIGGGLWAIKSGVQGFNLILEFNGLSINLSECWSST